MSWTRSPPVPHNRFEWTANRLKHVEQGGMRLAILVEGPSPTQSGTRSTRFKSGLDKLVLDVIGSPPRRGPSPAEHFPRQAAGAMGLSRR